MRLSIRHACLRVYECDALSAYRHLPALVVLPETVEQVQAVLKLCSSYEIPVVARWVGTGLAGGVLPVEDGIVLGLSKMNRILAIQIACSIGGNITENAGGVDLHSNNSRTE